jgi:hypothetical protein
MKSGSINKAPLSTVDAKPAKGRVSYWRRGGEGRCASELLHARSKASGWETNYLCAGCVFGVESWSMSESKQPEDCPDQRLCNSKRIAEQRSSESDHADSDNFIVLHVRLEPETKIFLRLCGSILYDRVFREP